MKIALVHEFLTQLGGAERVLQAFHEIFPSAPVYTLVYDESKTLGEFKNYDIHPSFLQKFPSVPKNYKWYLPLMPKAVESFNLSGFDIVLSDSSAFAKGIKISKPAIHVCYCHTPTRYLWESMDEYVSNIAYPGLVKLTVKPYLKYYLKGWDFTVAQRPDFFIANSQTVKERIKKYYKRDSEVIYPPVDTEFFKPFPQSLPPPEADGGGKGEGDYYFTVSRLEPYKKIDLVIEAFAKLGLPLKAAGDGSKHSTFHIQYSKFNNIEFLGRVSDEELRNLYSGAKAFVFPALEDGGIAVLEALSCGTPVIGLAKGGTAEFVRDGQNGVLFDNQTAEDIVNAVKRFENMKFDSTKLRESVLQFDKAEFKKKILSFIERITSPQPSPISEREKG